MMAKWLVKDWLMVDSCTIVGCIPAPSFPVVFPHAEAYLVLVFQFHLADAASTLRPFL